MNEYCNKDNQNTTGDEGKNKHEEEGLFVDVPDEFIKNED